MGKTYLAEKAQLDSQNQTLTVISGDISEINSKIAGVDLSNVIVAVLDFQYDDITIISGGYNSGQRRIAT